MTRTSRQLAAEAARRAAAGEPPLTSPTDALAAALQRAGNEHLDIGPCTIEQEDAKGILAALEAAGWRLVHTEQAAEADRVKPDDGEGREDSPAPVNGRLPSAAPPASPEPLREAADRLLREVYHPVSYRAFGDGPDEYDELVDEPTLEACRALAAALAAAPAGLDVELVKQAVVNIAKRHGLTATMPQSVAAIWGYTTATPVMDAEIAAEYARLASEKETP